MKNYKKLVCITTMIAVMAMVFAPQAQARKKRDLKKEAIEDLLREGVNNYEAGNYEDAFDYFEAAHKKGNIRATHNLALCYAQGHGVDKAYGVKQDYKKAIKWFEKAAKQGNTDAMYLMGSCYYYGGYGIKKDVKKAKQWIGKAASMGHPTAIDNLPKLQ